MYFEEWVNKKRREGFKKVIVIGEAKRQLPSLCVVLLRVIIHISHSCKDFVSEDGGLGGGGFEEIT